MPISCQSYVHNPTSNLDIIAPIPKLYPGLNLQPLEMRAQTLQTTQPDDPTLGLRSNFLKITNSGNNFADINYHSFYPNTDVTE